MVVSPLRAWPADRPQGGLLTAMVVVDVSDPAEFVAVRVALYVPGVVYVCVGFCAVELFPSPKSHAHEVGFPELWSVKTMVRGAGPEDWLVMKEAEGTVAGGPLG